MRCNTDLMKSLGATELRTRKFQIKNKSKLLVKQKMAFIDQTSFFQTALHQFLSPEFKLMSPGYGNLAATTLLAVFPVAN